MAGFPIYQPQLRVVNSGGSVIEGPYQFDPATAMGTRGIVLVGTEPWYVDENSGPFLNYQWSQIAYLLGYRYYVTLNFAAISGQAVSGSAYGLTLLDRLYQACVQNQATYAALQFSLFVGSPFYGVGPAGSTGFHPTLSSGKQGLYDLTLSFTTRDLQASPQAWAAGLW